MSNIDEDLMLRQISYIEKDNFSDPWDMDSLWGSMVRDYNLIYFALGNEKKYTVYSFRGGTDIEINCLKDFNLKETTTLGKVSEKLLMGYIIATDIAGETELLRIAVADKFKKQGVGTKLLNTYIEDLKSHCDKYFLEVRATNKKAKDLYEKAGYKIINTRKSYYKNPEEDAIVYSLEL